MTGLGRYHDGTCDHTIRWVPTTLARQPYALDNAAFPFPALAAVAGRAPLGGEREAALACFMLGRMCTSLVPPAAFPAAIRGARAAAVRTWLSSVALPAPLRSACLKLAEATAADAASCALALQEVITVTAPTLDRGAHSELVLLAARLRG